MTFGDLFGSFDENGRNPVWDEINYPGPISAPPTPAQAPKTIPVEKVSGPEATLTADVCIVGSGAGGAVIAARCAAAGKSVLVLEMGSYKNESDFRQLEAEGAGQMFWSGGLGWSEGGELGLLAGSTLGGGTVINSMACRPLPDDVRADWAAAGPRGRRRRRMGRLLRHRLDGARRQQRGDRLQPQRRGADRGPHRVAASNTTASPATPSSSTTRPTAATATPAASRAASARC